MSKPDNSVRRSPERFLNVLEPVRRPGLSLELRVILAAGAYGALVGALVASGLWWWLS